jgi:hypothetical protein
VAVLLFVTDFALNLYDAIFMRTWTIGIHKLKICRQWQSEQAGTVTLPNLLHLFMYLSENSNSNKNEKQQIMWCNFENKTDRMSWSRGWHSCLVFGMCRVKVLTWRLAMKLKFSWFSSVSEMIFQKAMTACAHLLHYSSIILLFGALWAAGIAVINTKARMCLYLRASMCRFW